jgi:AcrR family transcriptional regulator
MNTLFDIQENRKARKAERTRVDILEAAARAFARNTRATMQDIAAEAGYTVPSLYAYFRSKEEITQGLNDLVNREMMSAFDLPYPSRYCLMFVIPLSLNMV